MPRRRDRVAPPSLKGGWDCIDDDKKTIWLTAVHTGHPKATE